jgi:hypothetical protein
VSHRSEQRQPTIRLENASRTAASQNTPSPHGIRVASATHSRFGDVAVKSRCTRSGAGVALESCRVDPCRQPRRRNAPCQPCSRISRSTRLQPTWMPSRRSCRHTRSAPYVHPESVQIS